MYILVLNSGSSSLKFQIFKSKGKQITPYLKGIVDAINLPHSEIIIENQTIKFYQKVLIKNHQKAMEKIFHSLRKLKLDHVIDEIELIGHRVVHGGEKYKHAPVINAKVIADIKTLFRLAPLHNPPNLKVILSCKKLLPHIKQVAVFDTAFHQTMAPLAYLYALPIELYKKHQIRRYGFHGINNKYISEEATKILKAKKLPHQKLITCHLGNGCSVTAIKNGKSIETSMGYTPLEGLVMGTRSGDLDPALPLELINILKLSPPELALLLNKKSGLLGLTQVSSDMRIIYQTSREKSNKDRPKAIFAMEFFAYRLAKYINSYIGVLGGIDAIIFTGGIGEHAFYIRALTIKYLKHLGLSLDQSKNRRNETFINSNKSGLFATQIMIIPANEELEIAKQALQIKR